MLPSACTSSCCFSTWAHTDLDAGDVQQLQLCGCSMQGMPACMGASATEPCSAALAGESSGEAGLNRTRCLLLLWTEIWLFTEHQGVKGAAPALGCVSELPAGSQRGLGWSKCCPPALWPYPAWKGAGGRWGSLTILPKGFGLPPQRVLC